MAVARQDHRHHDTAKMGNAHTLPNMAHPVMDDSGLDWEMEFWFPSYPDSDMHRVGHGSEGHGDCDGYRISISSAISIRERRLTASRLCMLGKSKCHYLVDGAIAAIATTDPVSMTLARHMAHRGDSRAYSLATKCEHASRWDKNGMMDLARCCRLGSW